MVFNMYLYKKSVALEEVSLRTLLDPEGAIIFTGLS